MGIKIPWVTFLFLVKINRFKINFIMESVCKLRFPLSWLPDQKVTSEPTQQGSLTVQGSSQIWGQKEQGTCSDFPPRMLPPPISQSKIGCVISQLLAKFQPEYSQTPPHRKSQLLPPLGQERLLFWLKIFLLQLLLSQINNDSIVSTKHLIKLRIVSIRTHR